MNFWWYVTNVDLVSWCYEDYGHYLKKKLLTQFITYISNFGHTLLFRLSSFNQANFKINSMSWAGPQNCIQHLSFIMESSNICRNVININACFLQSTDKLGSLFNTFLALNCVIIDSTEKPHTNKQTNTIIYEWLELWCHEYIYITQNLRFRQLKAFGYLFL